MSLAIHAAKARAQQSAVIIHFTSAVEVNDSLSHHFYLDLTS